MLLHFSLFLFFTGLVVFLWSVDLAIFGLVLSWVGICTALYGIITFAPIFYHSTPFYTPLSMVVWQTFTGVLYVFYRVRLSSDSLPPHRREALLRSRDHYHKLFWQGLRKTAIQTALSSPSEIDTYAFMWTLDSLDEDHELERFFSGLPGFRSSKFVNGHLASLTEEGKKKLSEALIGFLDRTVSSDLLPEPIKSRRAIICAKALDPPEFPNACSDILFKIAFQDQYRGLQTAEFGLIVRGWGNSRHQRTALLAQATSSYILARTQQRDDSWFILASSELGIPETVLREYAADGDSLSLAILIYITRLQFSHFGKRSWPVLEFSKVLETTSQFNVQDTSPELQHDFCALWNQIVLKVQNDNDLRMAFYTMGRIRDVYLALHQDTDSAPIRFFASTSDQDDILWRLPSYPLCNIPGHHPDSTPHIHDSASTTFPPTVLHDDAALVPASVANPDAPSSSVPAPRHVDENLTDVPPLDNDIYVPGPFYPAHQTSTQNFRILATSQDPVATHMIQGGIDTSTTTIPLSILEPPASTPPLTSMASTSPLGAVAVQHILDRCTSSDVLDVPSLPSPTPVLDNMLPTGPQSSLDSPVTESNHVSSLPETYSSLLAPSAPGPSRPRLSSAPYMGAATEGEGRAKVASRKERDALDPPSAIWENIMTAPDLPPQLSSPLSITDVAIAGPSWRSLDVEHTGDHLPHSSHGQYNIV